MVILRILAQIIDLLVALLLLVFSFVIILPAFSSLTPGLSSAVLAVLVLLIYILMLVAVQLPFLKVGQTVGKGFFGLEVVSTNPTRPLTTSIMFQREVFIKLMTCYFICIPMLFGNTGGHDISAETKVVYRKKVRRDRIGK